MPRTCNLCIFFYIPSVLCKIGKQDWSWPLRCEFSFFTSFCSCSSLFRKLEVEFQSLIHVIQKCLRFHLFQHRPKSGFHQPASTRELANWATLRLLCYTPVGLLVEMKTGGNLTHFRCPILSQETRTWWMTNN